jgi:hypothetical protein
VPGTHPVPYEPVLGEEEVAAEFARARIVVDDVPAERKRTLADLREQTLDALKDPAQQAAYLRLRPLVGRLISAEFDTQTLGRRGIGRVSLAAPRLGGIFRKQLARPEVRSAIGPLLERIVIGGFASAVAAYQGAKPATPELRNRDPETVWRVWIPAAYAGLRDSPTLYAVVEEPTQRFLREARQLGFFGAVSRRKRLRARRTAAFYGASGAALWEANSSLADDRVD